MDTISSGKFPFPAARIITPSPAYKRYLDWIVSNETTVMDPIQILEGDDPNWPSARGVVARLDIAEARGIRQLISEGQGGFGYQVEYAEWRRSLKRARAQGVPIDEGWLHFPAVLAHHGPMPKYGAKRESCYEFGWSDRLDFSYGSVYWDNRLDINTPFKLVPSLDTTRVSRARRFHDWVEAERRSQLKVIPWPRATTTLHAAAS